MIKCRSAILDSDKFKSSENIITIKAISSFNLKQSMSSELQKQFQPVKASHTKKHEKEKYVRYM